MIHMYLKYKICLNVLNIRNPNSILIRKAMGVRIVHEQSMERRQQYNYIFLSKIYDLTVIYILQSLYHSFWNARLT